MTRLPLVLPPGFGRAYDMPDMRAVFKADGVETGNRYSVSEWWPKPFGKGPGAHRHEANDEIFYGIGGMVAVLAGDEWHMIERGGFLLVPAGVIHDFENRTDEPAALFNVFIPGGFEQNMPEIVRWYEENG